MQDPDSDPIETRVSGAEAGALAHLYRAEVYRSTIWRQRLDMTTNWAVVSTGIALSVAFSNERASPLPIVLVGLLSVMFLFLEARRYRYFTVWKYRARLLELAIYVPILKGKPMTLRQDKGHPISDDYISPQYRVTALRALGHRLRRNYGWLFAIQGMAYYGKILIHPRDVSSWEELMYRAHIGPIPGWVAVSTGLLLQLSWIIVAWYTWRLERDDKTTMADHLGHEDF
ncbi:MAG: DUF2270 domain-containing protein [Pseudomonadota bacterium]